MEKLKSEIRDLPGRVPYLDYFRGIIILLMIQGHTFRALLDKSVKAGSWFEIHEFIHGVVAPGFLFLAGFLFYHTIHNKEMPRLIQKGKHIFGVIILGYFLHLPFFSLQKIIHLWGTGIEYKFLNMDILQTIGYSLLIVLLIWILIRKYFIFTVILMMSADIIFLMFKIIPDNIFLASFFDKSISQFPLFPWSFFLLLGILTSRFVKKFNPAVLLFSLLLLFTAGLFPDVLFRTISDSGKVLFLFSVVQLLPETSSKPLTLFLKASRESLFLYMSHLMIVYGSVLNPGLNYFFKDSLSFPITTSVFIALAVTVYSFSYLLTGIKSKNPGSFNRFKYSVYTFLTIIFIFRKW